MTDQARAQVERVRALADELDRHDGAQQPFFYAAKIREALDGPNSKAAPNCSKTCSNGDGDDHR